MKLLVILSAVILHQVQAEVSTAPITRASNAFANKLYQQIAKKPGNILVCPVSLHVAMALLHQGAGGNTANELAKVLELNGSNDNIKNSYQAVLGSIQDDNLKIATKLYPADDVKLNNNYVSDAKQYFLSGVEKLDFKNSVNAANTMNSFVEKATNDKIRNLISPDLLTELTRLVIINAVHFQASWKNIFHTSYDGIFKVNKLQKVETKMMSQTDTFGYKEDTVLDAKILKMDYDVDGYSMLFVLPNKDEGLAEVETKLQDLSVTSLMKGLYPTRVEVTIPKFTLEQTIDLNDILKQMGLREIFIPRADLHNIAEGEHLFVSKVVQKTFINVHENGTEAAAATVLLETLSAVNENIVFFAGRPFHFYLLHSRTPKLVLFEGRFQQPENKGDKLGGSDIANLQPLIYNESEEEENNQPNISKPTHRPINSFPVQNQRPLSASPPENYNHHKNPNFNSNQPENTDHNYQGSNLNPYPQVGSNQNSGKDQNPNVNRYPQRPTTQNLNGQEFYNKQQNPTIKNDQKFNKEKGPVSNGKDPAEVPSFSEEQPPQRRPVELNTNTRNDQFDRSGIWSVNVDHERAWRFQHQREEQNQRRHQISGYNF